jgi:pimeloyl-ACP methyl ester carboxylesterase
MNLAVETPADDAPFISHFVTAQDGLKLHVREYGARTGHRCPLVCLPGLSRNSADFHVIAKQLARDQQRRVLALDYRGRGRSQHDPNPANYNPAVEVGDVLAVLTALEVGPAAFLATSRGGILTMLLATLRPAAITAVVLNDIGPIIDPAGLLRIKGYVGKLPEAETFEKAADILQSLFGTQFPRLTREDWLAEARRSFQPANGRLLPTYDPALAHALEGVPADGVLPPMWNQFDALAAIPLMVIRGGNSDILSSETVQMMRARRPDLHILEVPDEGHPPSLDHAATIVRVAAFIAQVNSAEPEHQSPIGRADLA